jgi:hypothetical protein
MNDLFAAWQSVNMDTTASIHAGLLRERQHPVLKQIRTQMIIELIGFVLFLIVYYDFFDGARKPLYANVLLVAAMVAVIAVNVVGYVFAKQGMPGENIRALLELHLLKMRIYAVIAVLARALMMVSVVVFFKANLIVALLFIGMLMVLIRLWVRRIRKIKTVYNGFLEPITLS